MRLTFQQRGDRWAHVIATEIDGAWRPVLESIEGEPPASPALQQFHIEEIAGRPAGLLVGMAGDSHFSLSATTAEGVGGAAGESTAALAFDVACRVKCPPERLGNSYRVAAAWRARSLSGGGSSDARWSEALELVPTDVENAAPSPSLRLLAEEGAKWRLTADGTRIAVRPAFSTTDVPGGARTIRWKYHIALAPARDGPE